MTSRMQVLLSYAIAGTMIVLIASCTSRNTNIGKAFDSLAARSVDSVHFIASSQAIVRAPLPEADTIPSTIDLPKPMLINKYLVLYNSVTGTSQQLSNTRGEIENVYASPNGKYAVYTTVVRYIDPQVGYIEGEKQPKQAIRHLIVMNIESGRTIREISPDGNESVCFDKWISASRLTFYTWNEDRAGESYVYDSFRDSLQKAPYRYWHE